MGVYTEQLALVRTAIRDLLTSGQHVSYNGRSLQMADLSTLRKLEKEYEIAAAAENNTAPCKGRSRITYIQPVS